MTQSPLSASAQENLLRQIFEISPDPFLFLEDGIFTDCNQAAVKILRAENKAQVLLSRPSQLSPEFQPDGCPSSEKAEEMIQTAIQNRGHRFEWVHRRLDGEDFPVEVLLTPVQIDGKIVIHVAWHDITEHKQVEQKLERERSLFAQGPLVVFHWQNAPGWPVEFVSQNVKELLGRSAKSLMSGETPYPSVVHPEDIERVAAEVGAYSQEGRNFFEQEYRLLRPDGSSFWIYDFTVVAHNPAGEITHYDGYVMDITERKRLEQAAQLRLRSTIDQSGEGIAMADLNGSLLYANAAWLEMHGYSGEDLRGKPLSIFHTPEQLQNEVLPFNEQVVAAGKNAGEVGHARKDGSTFPTLMTIALTRDENGNPSGLVASARDITEQKRAEEELRLQTALLESQSEASIDGILVVSAEGKILSVNQRFVELWNIPQSVIDSKSDEAALGSVLGMLTDPDEFLAKVNYLYERHAETSRDEIALKDGRVFDRYTSPVKSVDGTYYGRVWFFRDISERKEIERQIQQNLQRRGYQVEISTQISQEIGAAPQLADIFERVVTLTKERLGYYHTQLLRYDSAQDAVVLIKGYGETGEKMLAESHRMKLGAGLIGLAAASGNTVLRSDLATDPDWQTNPLLPGTRGEVAVPIKLGEQILGVLDVQSDTAGALTEDDRLLLEGLCGQIAVAIEQTRLRQEMAERLEEINRLYRAMSREGWKTYRKTADLPEGFLFEQGEIKPIEDSNITGKAFAQIPIQVLGGEVVGNLAVAENPQRPLSEDDLTFLSQVSEQIALALEGARLTAQTQSALEQSEKLFDISRRLTQATSLQDLVAATVESLDIPVVNRAVLGIFNYGADDKLESMSIEANWWDGTGHSVTAIGVRYPVAVFRTLSLFASPVPLFFADAFNDERTDAASLQIAKQLNLRAAAVLPLYIGTRQIGVLMLEAEQPYNFSQDEIRLFSSLAPQIATVLENRRQFNRAQQQAERESTLNLISQKIQSATTVDAVLQIAARELGHALGAPMTIAQLSMKDKEK